MKLSLLLLLLLLSLFRLSFFFFNVAPSFPWIARGVLLVRKSCTFLALVSRSRAVSPLGLRLGEEVEVDEEVDEEVEEEGEEERLLCRSVDRPERIIDFSRGRGILLFFFFPLAYLWLIDGQYCVRPRRVGAGERRMDGWDGMGGKSSTEEG